MYLYLAELNIHSNLLQMKFLLQHVARNNPLTYTEYPFHFLYLIVVPIQFNKLKFISTSNPHSTGYFKENAWNRSEM